MAQVVETRTKKPELAKLKPKEIEEKVIELGKQNIPPEKIGLLLRDQYGVPKVRVIGKKIGRILKEAKLETNSDLENLTKKQERIKQHLKKHPHDNTVKRRVMIYAARINKMKKLAARP